MDKFTVYYKYTMSINCLLEFICINFITIIYSSMMVNLCFKLKMPSFKCFMHSKETVELKLYKWVTWPWSPPSGGGVSTFIPRLRPTYVLNLKTLASTIPKIWRKTKHLKKSDLEWFNNHWGHWQSHCLIYGIQIPLQLMLKVTVKINYTTK